MKADEKKCPQCAEVIKRDALVCRHCGHQFDPAEVKAAAARSHKETAIGCTILVVLGLAVVTCTFSGAGDSGSTSNVSAAETAAEAAEDRRKGFHCLSAWDGSHEGVVDALKESLREPDSFEHVETRITPVNDKGAHLLTMKYRARNGFGGMNIGTLVATVENDDCAHTIVLADDQ